ncbi:MAG TPA: type VI secretion system ImpA family N-terminal domain-containing protein, partial [Variovorax sp.]|nr:type VI secretion system ImpA family N-terminal domain-containing protein [Variovorax sp.]
MNRLPVPLRAVPAPSSVARGAIDWLQPVAAHEPCGPSLEYDHDYAMLHSRMAPRSDAQYGSFVGTPEAPHWAEIERDCQRLLLRTKDINLLVWWCRARTRLGHAAGLAHVLGLLHDMLQAWPDAVHPQLCLDGEPEPVVRANALAG